MVFILMIINLCDTQDKRYEMNRYISITRGHLIDTEFTFFI